MTMRFTARLGRGGRRRLAAGRVRAWRAAARRSLQVGWRACALGAALSVSSAAAAQQAAAAGPPLANRCGEGLLLVVDVDSHGVEKRLADVVAMRVEQGLVSGLGSRDGHPGALSIPGIERARDRVAPALFKQRQFGNSSHELYEKLWKAAKSRAPPAGYVQTTIRRALDRISVELELVCLTPGPASPPEASGPGAHDEGIAGDGPRLVARKVVRVTDASEEALLQAVFAAARRIAAAPQRGGGGEPVIRILGGGRRRVALDTDLVIDASASNDPDDDAIELEWQLEDAAPECLGWRQEEGRLHFRASAPATCTFTITAREVVGAAPKIARTTVTVEALGMPRVRVRENAIVYADEPRRLDLAGTCESCASWRWVQIAGPLSTVPIECNGDRTPQSTADPVVACTVQAPVPGDYSFALTGWNALGEDRKEYTVTVVPPPVAVAYLPDAAIVHHRYVLDATGSHDPEGGELRYHWEVSKQPFHGCEAVPPRDDVPGVRLSAPTAARTEFIASRVEPSLFVRLTVVATRSVGGRRSSVVRCSPRTLEVNAPILRIDLAAGSDFEAERQRWIGTRLSAVFAVRVAERRVPWLGLRVEQNLVRNDGKNDTSAASLGGTFFGVTAFWWDQVHPYASTYARFWGHSTLGLQLGADLRLHRLLFGSGGVRYEYRPDDRSWAWVVTGGLGIGYDVL